MPRAEATPAILLPTELREPAAALASAVVGELSMVGAGSSDPPDEAELALDIRLARRLARMDEVYDALRPDDGPPGRTPLPAGLVRRLATEIGRMPRILFEGPEGRLWDNLDGGPTGLTLADALYIRERLLGLVRAARRGDGR